MHVVRLRRALFVGALVVLTQGISAHATTNHATTNTTTRIAGLYATGEGGKKGRADLHYELIEAPRCSFSEAYIACQTPWSWVWAPPGSAWISPYKNARHDAPAGDYVYRLTFDLVDGCGNALDPLTASFSSHFAADDAVDIFLNGNLIASSPGCSRVPSYSRLYCFGADSGFVEGLNALDFVVHNRGCRKSPTGLLVTDFCSRGTHLPQPVPEPGTGTILGLGLITMVAARLRSNRAR